MTSVAGLKPEGRAARFSVAYAARLAFFERAFGQLHTAADRKYLGMAGTAANPLGMGRMRKVYLKPGIRLRCRIIKIVIKGNDLSRRGALLAWQWIYDAGFHRFCPIDFPLLSRSIQRQQLACFFPSLGGDNLFSDFGLLLGHHLFRYRPYLA